MDKFVIFRASNQFRILAHEVAKAEGKTLSQMFREFIEQKASDSQKAPLQSAR